MKVHICAMLLFLSTQVVFAQNAAINVMPYPQSLTLGNGKLRISSSFTIGIAAAAGDSIVEFAANRLLRRLNARTLAYFNQKRASLQEQPENATLTIQVKEKSPFFIGTDESYQLSIGADKIVLAANNTIGALRGMETLLQLADADADGYFFPLVEIKDAPRFRWRGMMMDVSRHFIPMDILKRNVDAMSMVKLNVLHLHLSDDEGFRVESKIFPKLQELGSNGQYYTQAELKDLVSYAAARGIMVYPEFDLPGHSQSWFAGYPELASKPGPYKPGPRFNMKPGASVEEMMAVVRDSATPTLDPTREAVYQFLDKFIGEMTTVFPAPYIHIGADENNGVAWKQNPQILQFMKDKGIKDTHELQAYFVKRMYAIMKKHNRTMIGWEELYNPELPKDVVVQAWIPGGGALGMKSISPLEVAEKGNPVLVSTGFYLDLFLPAHVHYLNSNIPSAANEHLPGGEAALWAEVVDEYTFEGRAWPRAAAVAERLWSPESVKDVDDMYRRLFVLSDRLEEAGLNHRLNIIRMLTRMSNGQDIHAPLTILQTLAPLKGYRRTLSMMTKSAGVKYQNTPLVNLADMVSIDSKTEWDFRKLVEAYLDNDTAAKTTIENELRDWKEAASRISVETQHAPNLKAFEIYTIRIAQAADIGLQALEKPLDESEKAAVLKQLEGMRNRTDEVEIRILPEIEALVSGSLAPLPASYPMF